tara:strand:- start:314 stop:517 length:204 start_codon:yes stop_codon:yes gene_type:complete
MRDERNECEICGKRLKLARILCKCERALCGLHLPPEKHGCDFDYKTLGKDAIRKSNPKIEPKKVQKD